MTGAQRLSRIPRAASPLAQPSPVADVPSQTSRGEAASLASRVPPQESRGEAGSGPWGMTLNLWITSPCVCVCVYVHIPFSDIPS